MPDYLFNDKLLDKINHETAILPPAINFCCEQIQVSISADLFYSLTQLAHNDAYRLVIPLNSTESLMIDGRLFICQAGQALLMAPGQHSLFPGTPYCAALDNSARIITLVYNQTIMESLRANAGHTEKYAGSKAVSARLLACNPCQICRKALYGLLDACNDRRPGCQKAICLQAQTIALEIWRNDCSAVIQGKQNKLMEDLMEDLPDALAENYRFMQSNLHEPLSVDLLAEMAGLSKTHYIRLFGRRFGKSPYQMLTLMRLQEARILLEKDDLPVAEICRRCGYHSPSHFAANFRREAGLSPLRYRIKVRKSNRTD